MIIWSYSIMQVNGRKAARTTAIKLKLKKSVGVAYANELGLSFDASMTSNDFAANLYDTEVTFVTKACGIGSIVMSRQSQINDRPFQFRSAYRPTLLDAFTCFECDAIIVLL